MAKRILPLCLLALLLCACSEDDNNVEEYPNWKTTNDTYWQELYNTTKQRIAGGDTSWKILPKYSYASTDELKAEDYVIVHVKTVGEGTESPLFTDSVLVHYRGHLLPSTTYTAGYQFDTSYAGDLNPLTATPSKFAVSGVVAGWTTALQKMHVGDRWDVYVPYQLGYGTVINGSIPAYSTLIFDMMLTHKWHAGETVPSFK